MRKAVVGMIQQVALAGMESGISQAYSLKVHPGEYSDGLIYSAMIHAGVGGFIVPGATFEKDEPLVSKDIAENEFLRSRCEIVDDEYYVLLRFFSDLVKSHWIGKHTPSSSFEIPLFLADLSFAMAHGTAIVSVFDPPDPKKYYGKLTPKLLMSLERLILSMKPCSLDVIVPSYEVLLNRSDMLMEMLESRPYAEYEQLHAEIDGGKDSEAMAAHIKKTAIKIRRKYEGFIGVRSALTAISPVAVRFVEEFVGSTASTVMERIMVGIASAESSRRKVVVYDYGTVHEKMLREHYGKIAEQKASGYLSDDD